jgi:hypothetical protein
MDGLLCGCSAPRPIHASPVRHASKVNHGRARLDTEARGGCSEVFLAHGRGSSVSQSRPESGDHTVKRHMVPKERVDSPVFKHYCRCRTLAPRQLYGVCYAFLGCLHGPNVWSQNIIEASVVGTTYERRRRPSSSNDVGPHRSRSTCQSQLSSYRASNSDS